MRVLFLFLCSFLFLTVKANNRQILNEFESISEEHLHHRLDSLFDHASNDRCHKLKSELENILAEKQSLNLKVLYLYLDLRLWWSSPPILENNLLTTINKLSPNSQPDVVVLLKYLLAEHYINHSDYPHEFEYLLKAENNVTYDCSYSGQQIWWTLAKAYYDFNEYEKSKFYLEKAIPCSTLDHRRYINLYNTRALIKARENDLDATLQDLQKALEMAKIHKDSAWIGILSGNMGSEFYRIGKIKKAIPLIREDYELSVKHEQWTSATNALMLLIEIALGQENYDIEKIDSMTLVVERISQNEHSLSIHKKLLELKASIAWLKKDYKLAYELISQSAILNDSLFHRKDDHLIHQAEVRAATARHLNQVELIEAERKQERTTRNSIIGISVLIIIILFLLIRLNRNRRLEEKKRLELEKENTLQKLETAKEKLSVYVKRIREKNDVIQTFQEELNQLSLKNSEEDLKKQGMLQELYDSSILTEEDWIDFKRMFEKVHAGFFQQLLTMRSDITTAEMRFLALLKLGLEINEMAAMLGISPNSVRRTRLRLKTKLGLDDISDLITLVNEMS